MPTPAFPMLRWGLVFLACPVRLTDPQQRTLVRLAAQAWFTDQPHIAFDEEMFHGELRASTEVVSLGSLVGQGFEAEVHLPEGSTTVRFLVTERQLRAAGGEVAEA